ncbi:hypothetical protein KP509_14G097200 [Ceratopteris richardii]|uniref:Uncharacterized protein n=1 Tax=Ceratopteris richardii TaxID=49495 RepID=A0A8T2TCR4_CERRI|nr:hypothetical protein KP509_14G097200 [Ceratopteris richardii]
MGNHLSCVSPLPPNSSELLPPNVNERLQASSNAVPDLPANLIFLDCETATLCELQGPLSVAEAMLEFPGRFLCLMPDLDSISAGACGPRVAAVPADRELEPSRIYLLLHMNRLNSRFRLREMDFFRTLKDTQRATGKQAFSGPLLRSKVVPLPGDDCNASTGDACSESGVQLKSSSLAEIRDANPATYVQHAHSQSVQRPYLRRANTWIPGLETVHEYGLQR